MNEFMLEVQEKAGILIDALPYIRDFRGKVMVIMYGCGEWLDGKAEQRLMQDIALLASVGMKPIVVHDTQMGVDKFRENKRIAKLIELCGRKAIGICGIDLQTLHMTLENGYIPVIVPNDIDNEMTLINPEETAMTIAVKMRADKLIYLCASNSIYKEQNAAGMYEIAEVRAEYEKENVLPEIHTKVEFALEAVSHGVNRAHIIDGRVDHALLLELFSIRGIGTAIRSDEGGLYHHEEAELSIHQ